MNISWHWVQQWRVGMTTQTKDGLLQDMQAARLAFRSLLDRIPLGRWEQLGVEGTWSLKDIIGHLATWDEESMNRVRKILSGGAISSDPDFNERKARELRRLSVQQVRDLFSKNYLVGVSYLRALSEDEVIRPDVLKQVRGCIVDHYKEHRAAIEAWLEKQPGA
jgi:hypothetical protein